MLGFWRNRTVNANQCLIEFFGAPEHRWIWADRTLRARFTELLSALPQSDLETLIRRRKLLVLYSDARMSCAFHQYRAREAVLVFPDLKRLLLSPQFHQGQAVLAHEFGHIVLGHGEKRIEAQKAQFEADAYAASLGYGRELARALADFPHTEEVVTRIERLVCVS